MKEREIVFDTFPFKTETVKGHDKVITVGKSSFNLFLHKEHGYWRVTDPSSGRGFGSNISDKKIEKTIKNAQKRIKTYGINKFKKLLKGQPTIEQAKKNAIVQEQRRQRIYALNKVLGFTPPICPWTMAMGKVSIDVIKFDTRLRTPDGMSTAAFIKAMHGEKVMNEIKDLL